MVPTRRQELVGRLRAKPGLARFLRVTKAGLLRVDRAAVTAEQKLDGEFLLRTSDPTLSAEDVALGATSSSSRSSGRGGT